MNYTKIIYLVSKEASFDNIGNEVYTETKTKVHAKESYVRTSEFYNAVGVGLKPNAELIIKKSNYNNEEELEMDNIRYTIIRTIPTKKMDLALVVQRKTGNYVKA